MATEQNTKTGAPRGTEWAEEIRASAENRPGTYQFLGPRNEVLYVGKSVRLRTRLLSWLRGSDSKAVELLRVTRGVRWRHAASEFEALLQEFRQIRKLRPRFNVVHRKDRRFAWIRLTAEPAPRLVATLHPGAGPTRRGGRRRERIFGPFPARRSLPHDLATLAKVLGLRDCSAQTTMVFADQMDLWSPPLAVGCPRGELGSCPAPCAAGCTETEYQLRVEAALAFLEGSDDTPLSVLAQRMEGAAREEAFELAALYRDRIKRVTRLRERIVETRRQIESLTFVYTPGEVHHLVRRGQVVWSGPDPFESDPGTRAELASRMGRALAEPLPPLVDLDDEAREELFLVTRWFRSHPAERNLATPVEAYLDALSGPWEPGPGGGTGR